MASDDVVGRRIASPFPGLKLQCDKGVYQQNLTFCC